MLWSKVEESEYPGSGHLRSVLIKVGIVTLMVVFDLSVGPSAILVLLVQEATRFYIAVVVGVCVEWRRRLKGAPMAEHLDLHEVGCHVEPTLQASCITDDK